MKYAVIIKHPYRDFDYRIDIIDVPEDASMKDVQTLIEREMLGPFEVIAITSRINFDRRLDLTKIIMSEGDSHAETHP